MSAAELKLKINQKIALDEVKRRLEDDFPVDRLLLFGSVARGEAGEGSDIDLLIVTQRRMSHEEQYAMVDTVFDVKLAHDVNINIVVVDRQTWDGRDWTVLALHREVACDGIPL
jgi:predicted nucleotidyltransferase